MITHIIKNNTKIIKSLRNKFIIKPWISPVLLRCIRNRASMHKKNNIVPQQ